MVCCRCAESCRDTWGRRNLGGPPVGLWCRCTSCRLSVNIVSTRWGCCRLLHIYTEPFTFRASFPCLELGDIFLQCVRDVYYVINVEKPPKTPVQNSHQSISSTMMKNSGLRTEPWCTSKPKPNSSLHWQLSRTRFCVWDCLAWMTPTAHISTPRLLKVHMNFKFDEGKVELFAVMHFFCRRGTMKCRKRYPY